MLAPEDCGAHTTKCDGSRVEPCGGVEQNKKLSKVYIVYNIYWQNDELLNSAVHTFLFAHVSMLAL